jgi:GNAT superfamily N-acetyltransferase
MQLADVEIVVSDPQGADALALLREAAIEARALYPELHAPGAAWPTNERTQARGVYLVAYQDGRPVGCGALRPLSASAVEIRRMFVTASARRQGVGLAILEKLESSAVEFGYAFMRLETGFRQLPAMKLYQSFGFERIPPFGEYANDSTSVCFEKAVRAGQASGA